MQMLCAIFYQCQQNYDTFVLGHQTDNVEIGEEVHKTRFNFLMIEKFPLSLSSPNRSWRQGPHELD